MKQNKGYTLIELFAAVAIVAVAIYAFATLIVVAAILTISSVTYLSHYKKNKLIQTAERVAADIYYAQSQAMTEGA